MIRAIVVGGAPTVKGTGLGPKVDEFDIVIRCNNFVTHGFENDVGSKTDVWVVNTSRSTGRRDCKLFQEVWYKRQPPSKLAQKLTNKQEAKLSELISCKEWPVRDFDGKNPSVGLRAIMHALTRFDSVTIYGFTFFTEGDGKMYSHYYDDVGLNEYYKKYFIKGSWAKDKDEKELIQSALEQGKCVVRGDYHDGETEKSAIIELFKQGKIEFLNPQELLDVQPISECNQE